MGKNLSTLGEIYRYKARTKLDKGTHKYILIELRKGSESVIFIRSKRYAEYHRDILDKFKGKLQGFRIQETDFLTVTRVECLGGGRITFDGKKVHIYGYSKSYGQGDHDLAKKCIVEDLGIPAILIKVDFGGY